MNATVIKRVFKHKNKNLEDINPKFSVEMVLNHYAGIYPELTNAIIENKGIQNNNQLLYEFKTTIGTKG